MKLSNLHTPNQVKTKANAVDVKLTELEDAIDKDMPKDHIKFLFDDLKVLIRELQDGN
jgi:hypothetical protein